MSLARYQLPVEVKEDPERVLFEFSPRKLFLISILGIPFVLGVSCLIPISAIVLVPFAGYFAFVALIAAFRKEALEVNWRARIMTHYVMTPFQNKKHELSFDEILVDPWIVPDHEDGHQQEEDDPDRPEPDHPTLAPQLLGGPLRRRMLA